MRWGFFFLLILLFALLGFAGWVFYTQYRARRLGLPAPSWKSYIPFTSESATAYRGSNFPSPRRGGIMGWVGDKVATLRNKRTHRGAYEDMDPGGGRGHGHDEVWDARVGVEGDTAYSGPRGYYEEQELGLTPPAPPSSAAKSPYHHEYDGGEAFAVRHEEPERGRSLSRGPPGSDLGDTPRSKNTENPFADPGDPGSLRSVSPRPVTELDTRPATAKKITPDT